MRGFKKALRFKSGRKRVQNAFPCGAWERGKRGKKQRVSARKNPTFLTPFVVSLSNHVRRTKSKTSRFSPLSAAWFDKLTTNGKTQKPSILKLVEGHERKIRQAHERVLGDFVCYENNFCHSCNCCLIAVLRSLNQKPNLSQTRGFIS